MIRTRSCASFFADDLHAQRVLSIGNGVVGRNPCRGAVDSRDRFGLAPAAGLSSQHSINQVDRLLSNGGFEVRALFAPWAEFVLACRTSLPNEPSQLVVNDVEHTGTIPLLERLEYRRPRREVVRRAPRTNTVCDLRGLVSPTETRDYVVRKMERQMTTLVRGRVHHGSRPLAGAIIELWIAEACVARAVADAEGIFKAHLGALPPIRNGRLRVFFTHSVWERDAKLEVQSPAGALVFDIDVAHAHALDPAPAPAHGIVRGQARPTPAGDVGSILVHVYDRDLNGDTLLGSSPVSALGGYEVTYDFALLSRPRKEQADIVLRAEHGNASVERGPFCHAPPHFELDLDVESILPVRSELERLLAALSPVLGSAPIGSLGPGQIDYLACTTDTNVDQIRALVVAERAAGSAQVPHDLFYAFARQGVAEPLLQHGDEVLRRALVAAVANGIVPKQYGEQLDQWMERIAAARIDAGLQPGSATEMSLGDVLGESSLTLEAKRVFARAVLPRVVPTEAQWTTLTQALQLTADGVDELRALFDLATLANGALPLLRALRAVATEGTQGAPPRTLRGLARLDQASLVSILEKLDSSPNASADRARRAAAIARTIDAWYPTAALARELARESNPADAAALALLASRPALELARTRLDDQFRQETAVDRAAFLRLQSYQRLMRLDVHAAEMRPLLADGLVTAHRVAGVGRTSFVGRYAEAFGETRAGTIYDSARRLTALSLHLVASYRPDLAVPMPSVLGDVPDGSATFPDWTALFGTVDFCACAECSSVLSPAAYLADLLHFLGDVGFGTTPLDVLTARRPDLLRIELSCDNTNVPLPYVDLVNEVLEAAIVGAPAWADGARWQTTGRAEDLRAGPAHVDARAYSTLSAAVFPLVLPFDRDAELVQAQLQQLGVEREDVVRLVHPTDAPDLARGGRPAACC